MSIGAIGTEATEAAETLEKRGIHSAHYDIRYVKPLDDVLLHEVFGRFKDVITIEDGCVQGGMGSAVTEWAMEHGYAAKVARLGVLTGISSMALRPNSTKSVATMPTPSSRKPWPCAKHAPHPQTRA